MAVNLTIALLSGQTGTVPDESGLVKELVTITGASSSANDTGTYTSIMKQPTYVQAGCCSYTISGQVVSFLDEVGLGNAVTGATVFGIQ